MQLIHSFVLLSFFVATISAAYTPSKIEPALKPRSHSPLHNEEPPEPRTSFQQRRATNAQRFANGLPPLRPRRLHSGTKRGDVPSPLPGIPGKIQVLDPQSAVLGYLSERKSDAGFVGFTEKANRALKVQKVPSSNSRSELRIASGPAEHPYLGLCLPDDSPPLSADDGAVYLARVGQAPPSAGPVMVSNSLTTQTDGCESAVWTINSGDGSISVHWQNDASEAEMAVRGQLYLGAPMSYFIFNAMPPLANDDSDPSGWGPVTFKFVPDA